MKTELLKELEALADSFSRVNKLWNEAEGQVPTQLAVNYAFDQSFDELNLKVQAWVNTQTFAYRVQQVLECTFFGQGQVYDLVLTKEDSMYYYFGFSLDIISDLEFYCIVPKNNSGYIKVELECPASFIITDHKQS